MNFFSVANARPLSNDSLARAIHSSIVFSGRITWIAKAELTITTFFLSFRSCIIHDMIENLSCIFRCLSAIQINILITGEAELSGV